jgi:integration host factor subunit alpha
MIERKSMFLSEYPSLQAASSAAGYDEPEKIQGTLTRHDIAETISERCPGLSKREAKKLVDSVIEEMTIALCRGETVKLHDFGSFVVRSKGEREGRNPRTGAKVPIEPRIVVVFKPSPNMKGTVNGEEGEKQRPGRKKGAAKKPGADRGGALRKN